MEKVFVDTSAWIAFLDSDDNYHEKVNNFVRASIGKTKLITSDYVIYETITYLNCSLKSPDLAKDFYLNIMNTSGVEIITITSQNAEKSLEDYLFKYVDKNLSVVDATSFLIMKKFNVEYVLSLDKHFRQVGFSSVVV